MYYLPILRVTPGMTLGQTLYHRDGRVLLHRGMILCENYIEKIRLHGFTGLYIDDEFSKDIVIPEVITEQLRVCATKQTKRVFASMQFENSDNVSKLLPEIKQTVNDMICQILSAKVSAADVMDLKTYDEYTFQHSVNVTVISAVLGSAAGLSHSELLNLSIAALLHDIGKIKLPIELINKPCKLTKDEYEDVKKHPALGYGLTRRHMDFSPMTCFSILQHHEKYDGTGYPYGRKGAAISKFARIIALADVYDAISSNRPYAKAMTPAKAFEFITSHSCSHFDPEIVRLFVGRISPYPVGSVVCLSDGRKGIVARNYPHYPLRPKIKLFKNSEDIDDTPQYIDLKNDYSSIDITIKDTE